VKVEAISFLTTESFAEAPKVTRRSGLMQTPKHGPIRENMSMISSVHDSRSSASRTGDIRPSCWKDGPFRARIAATPEFGVGQWRSRCLFVRLIDSIHGEDKSKRGRHVD
jgi:hypothetical protein